MEKKQYNIALVIKTDGLEYDDRIRKEILSIQRINPQVRFTVFAMLPVNEETRGVSDYGVPYKSVYIKARDKYPSKEKVLLKAYQFWKVVKNDLKYYDAVWTADCETIFTTLLVKTKCLIWDLHELPTSFLKPWYKRLFLRYVINRPQVVLHANNHRLSYLKEIGAVRYPNRHFVLSNYPEPSDHDFSITDSFELFQKWKRDKRCVYLQGLNDAGRAAYETIAAILGINGLNAVVVGKFDDVSKQRIISEFSDSIINERVFFVGRIPQKRIASYMRECCLSAVFYKNTRMNNYFCDANRFYLAVSQGLPVVVGNNPSMRDIIEEYQFGISIDNDGDDMGLIKRGLEELLEHYDYYKQKVEENKDKMLWDSQDEIIKKITKIICDNA